MMPYTMMIWDKRDVEVPALDDLFRVIETEADVCDGTYVELEPYEGAYLLAELADACAARDALARECNQLEADREYNAALVVERDAKLAQARAELKDLQAANRICEKRLAHQTSNCDFWFKTCLAAEIERDQIRKEAQEQSDLVQRDRLSPVEAEGLRQQLAQVGAQTAAAREAIEWLWGFWDGNTLRAIPGSEEDIGEAWNKLLAAGDAFSKPWERRDWGALVNEETAVLLERLAILDAAEAALAGCGLTCIYHDFDGLADAIEQMVQRLVQLEGGQALQAERQLRREAEQELKQRQQQIDLLSGAEMRAHQAEKRAKSAERKLGHVCHALTAAGVSQTYNSGQPITTASRVVILRQRADQAEALAATLAEVHAMLDCSPQHPWHGCKAQEYSNENHYMCHSLEARELLKKALEGEMPTNTQALVQLVTPELAELLERLAQYANLYDAPESAYNARALAARIREALEVNK